ncbi:unnamed protein product, partial [marine sediment metagenome]
NVTIVTHSSGYIHCLYENATIDKSAYQYFVKRLKSYLSAGLDLAMFANFLRCNQNYQKYFQLCRDCHGHPQFLKAEVLFHYEHGSNFRIADATHEKLLAEVSDEDFVSYELPGRIRCDRLDEFLRKKKPDVRKPQGRAALKQVLDSVVPDARRLVDKLADFVHTEPRLPAAKKNYVTGKPIRISVEQTREEIIDYLQNLRQSNTTADLAFYAYRDMASCDWLPFVRAAVERNPVSLELTKSMPIDEA